MVRTGTYQGKNSKAYCYAFNGKEQDSEWDGNGNMYDYGFRIYNPRIGKFLSVDPLAPEFPWWSPYHFAGLNPVINIDLDGLEPVAPDGQEFDAACTLLSSFETSDDCQGAFQNIDKATFVSQLRERLENPDGTQQGHNWLCGMAAATHVLVNYNPELYIKTMIDIYENGFSMVSGRRIEASDHMLQARVSNDGEILGANGLSAIDYMMLGSLQNSLEGASDLLQGGQFPNTVEALLDRRFGFDINQFSAWEGENLEDLQASLGENYWTIMLIDKLGFWGEGNHKDGAKYKNKGDDGEGLDIYGTIGIHYIVVTDLAVSDDGKMVTVTYWDYGNDEEHSNNKVKGQRSITMPTEQFEQAVKATISVKQGEDAGG